MSVKVEAAAPFDFERSQYNVVFNTSGSTLTPGPSARARALRWSNLSYGLIAGGDGKATAGPVAFVRSGGSASAPAMLALRAMPQQFTFNPNSDEFGTEYTITFARSLFGGAALPPVKSLWTFNVLVSAPNLHDSRFHFVSGLSSCDRCFSSPKLDVTKPFDVVQYVTVGPTSGDLATHLVRVEVENSP